MKRKAIDLGMLSRWPLARHRTDLVALLFFLVACHDAPRDNPFDPVLTPAVELQVALDDTAGTAALTWTQYEGQQPFREYRVLRRIADRIQEDTLDHIAAVDRASFQDTTIAPDREYVYRVEVVNQAGFAAKSQEVAFRSFQVRGVELLEARGDGRQGVIALRWQRYRGADFSRYEVWRRASGEDPQRLQSVAEETDTLWVDDTPLPAKEYSYWVKTLAADKNLESQRREVSYELPPIELRAVVFSSETATAGLSWTRYQGPRFAGYEVGRRAEGIAEQVVADIPDIERTTYTDSLLDGNTEYIYRVLARTSWEGIAVASAAQSGRFYGLEEVRQLPGLTINEVQAVGLALDEQDQLYVAVSAISTTTARVMGPGISIQYPAQRAYRGFFTAITPDRLSPVYLAAGQGRLYVTARTQADSILVGAVQVEGQKVSWTRQVDAGEAFPAGIHAEADGACWMVDTQGMIYRFSAEGVPEAPSDRLRLSLESDTALPLRHLVVGAGVALGGLDQFFLLTPERERNHLIGRTRVSPTVIGGKSFVYDDGVGPGNGETLNPLILAYDRSRTRLMVLEAQGRLQVLNAAPEEVPRRYITKWGRFGRGEGEFQISPPTAVSIVVDSQGRIYVADGEERIQVFAP